MAEPTDDREPWEGTLCGAKHRGMLCDRVLWHAGDHVDINGPLPGHTWTDTDALRDRIARS